MGRDREEGQGQQNQPQQALLIPKTEENIDKEVSIEILEVIRGGGGGDDGGGGGQALAVSQPSQKPDALTSAGSCGGGGGGNPKKRLRTVTVLEEVDKKFLLEQYVSERQKNVNLQLQNRVSQLEREMREMERLSTEKEKVHLETLSLAENHHRENVLAEVGRLLEAEFNCSICNEVYIEPAVLNCGHTYCSYCINRALQTDFLCPVCRTGYNFNPPAKNIEMRNFINKMFQMLPEEMRTTRDQVLQERAALPMPDANASNNRNRTRRRRSRSVSPFDLFGMFNDDDAFRERRSRSRSVSVSTLSDSDDSDDDSAISFFDLRASPRSPSPELRPLRSRTRSRSPTGGTRRRRSPARYSGLIPLPWRNTLWGSGGSSSRASPSSRYAIPATQEERGDRRPRQVSRRGRAFSTGRSFSGSMSGPRRYGWGPPRRQIHSSANRAESNNNNNNSNDNNNASSSGAGNNVTADGAGNSMRRRMSVGYNPYRSLASRSGRWGAFGSTRDSTSTSSSLRIPVVTPRIPRRPLILSDNFEDLFSRRDPAPSTAVSSAEATETPPQPLSHDHSYTSNAASAIVAAISAARARASSVATSLNAHQPQQGGSGNTENSSAELMSGIERLQEQTRRLYAATNVSAPATNRSGTGHLSQALALLAPPSASENNNNSGSTVDLAATGNTTSSALTLMDAEPRRSPRIAHARQFRHRFLTPATNNSLYRESERDRDLDMRERGDRDRGEQNNNSSQSFSQSQSQGSASSNSQSQGQSSQHYISQESQSTGAGGTGSIASSTGGTRGSSVGDSPTSSEIDALPSVAPMPIDDAGLSAMRRFVNDLHSYRSGREGRDRERGERGERDSRRNAANSSGSSRSSRENRPRPARRSSVELLEEMELF